MLRAYLHIIHACILWPTIIWQHARVRLHHLLTCAFHAFECWNRSLTCFEMRSRSSFHIQVSDTSIQLGRVLVLPGTPSLQEFYAGCAYASTIHTRSTIQLFTALRSARAGTSATSINAATNSRCGLPGPARALLV